VGSEANEKEPAVHKQDVFEYVVMSADASVVSPHAHDIRYDVVRTSLLSSDNMWSNSEVSTERDKMPYSNARQYCVLIFKNT